MFQKVGTKFLGVRKMCYLCWRNAIVAQLVEHWLPKPRVAGSSPVYRSKVKQSGASEPLFSCLHKRHTSTSQTQHVETQKTTR